MVSWAQPLLSSRAAGRSAGYGLQAAERRCEWIAAVGCTVMRRLLQGEMQHMATNLLVLELEFARKRTTCLLVRWGVATHRKIWVCCCEWCEGADMRGCIFITVVPWCSCYTGKNCILHFSNRPDAQLISCVGKQWCSKSKVSGETYKVRCFSTSTHLED